MILYTPQMSQAVIQFQAVAHSALGRQVVDEHHHALEQVELYVVSMQGHGRAELMWCCVQNQLAKLNDVLDIVVCIQAAARAYMAQKMLLNIIHGLHKVTLVVASIQALA